MRSQGLSEYLRQRQREGIEAARANSVHFGRAAMERPDNYEEIKSEWKNGIISAREAGRRLGISHTGFRKWELRDMADNSSAEIV